MRIEINRETCIRSGKCYFEQPALLSEDDDGFPVPVADVISVEQREAILDVIENCPTGSISLVEDEPPAS